MAPGEPLGDVAEQRLAELAHRLRRQPEVAVGAALELAGVAQRLFELLQGARVDRGLVAELSGEGVQVDVVETRARVGLLELLGELVELGDVLQHPGAVAESEALAASGKLDEADGSDIGPMIAAGAPAVGLSQNGTYSFDLHHTPDDTLDKVDPAALRQNVAAWTAMLAVAADAPGAFGPVPARQ